MEVDEALGKLGITGQILHYTMIGVARGFMSCFHMLAINYIGKLMFSCCLQLCQLEMWANAQRDGRPAEYMWRPLFNAAKFG